MAAITAVGYGEYERVPPHTRSLVSRGAVQQQPPPPQHKDYSRPLHVDCSVEYELPNAAKPPAGARSEPLLMIHPCYYRRAESQRRSPFVNNLPAGRTAPQPPPLAAPAAPAHYPRCYNADPRQAAVAPPPKLCPSMVDAGRWTTSIQHSPMDPSRLQAAPHHSCHDRATAATPCTAVTAPLSTTK
ncbi:centrosomal and chromosomal factor [Nilaparvata lugens]|uniref:centrosomal and chromosomal factor n=1 Tax=Nilaparvata lugens TaxID=108931 RepID=UPI00193CC995|nr:centrosomal and chromosomal factor [Nilaparvata lugens]